MGARMEGGHPQAWHTTMTCAPAGATRHHAGSKFGCHDWPPPQGHLGSDFLFQGLANPADPKARAPCERHRVKLESRKGFPPRTSTNAGFGGRCVGARRSTRGLSKGGAADARRCAPIIEAERVRCSERRVALWGRTRRRTCFRSCPVQSKVSNVHAHHNTQGVPSQFSMLAKLPSLFLAGHYWQ